jgi:glycogen operon protein
MTSRLSGGAPFPLGATPDRRGTNFALASVHAERVELCLFNAAGDRELERVRLPERTGDIWHGHVAGIGAGQLYGYRVYGPFDPARGHRFNHHKLLIDPYAKAIDRPFRLAPSLYGHIRGDARADLSFDATDSAADMPKAIVTAPGAAVPPGPRVKWEDTIIYELHAKGFTKLSPKVPEKLRGTLSGLAQPAALEHLVKLGITSVELMPLAAFIDERHLPPLGLSNYWGYNPVTFLAPEPRYLANGGNNLRAAVARIHEAGIEVIIDVVFNHSGESDELGPTICYRGIDNATYYRLKDDDPRFYDNVTGCGHTLAADRPIVLRLIMDAMRHWVTEFGIDGFRFDLAATLGRGETGFDANGPFLATLRQDPLLSQLKLIAEPWDVGVGGYQGGAFPAGMAEWNDQFRDDVRRFWQGTSGVGALASRLAGSSDRFNRAGRMPGDSINHVTAHDGFSLADLVSYTRKRNEDNGEHNRDGTDQNHSWTHGIEGPSDDPAIVAARRNDMRALLATLLVSRGTPMLRAGDELGQSQGGNNNAYAQDNATTWIDWAAAAQFADLTGFVQRLVALRKAHPALRRNRFLTGTRVDGGAYKDATWRRADGVEFVEADWRDGARRFIGLELFEDDDDTSDHVYVLVNGGAALSATLPPATGQWKVALDSTDATPVAHGIGIALHVPARAVLVLIDDAKAAAQDHPEFLERLALLAGISPEHRDANGHDHIVSAETKRALLAAMRLSTGTAGEVRASLRELEAAPWRAALPPFLVARAGMPFAFLLIVDRTEAGRLIEARLSIEGGNTRALQLRPSDGSLIGARRINGRVREQWRVATEIVLPVGLHTLSIGDAVATVAATPERVWQPAALGDGKCWGVSTNLYSARSDGDWGIGDFTALRQIGEHVAQRGGALVGINPLHALFPDKPNRASPYYPSDRRFLEAAYIDPRAVRGYAELAASDPWFVEAERAAAKLREATLIDYGAVFKLKRQALAKLWTRFREAGGEAFAAFRRFVVEGGDSLRIFAAHEAARVEGDPDFHMFLQFCADRALADAMTAANLPIGLYRDLAVGPAPDGAELAAGRDWFAPHVSVGAPPDPYSDIGQVWGVPAYDPHALARAGYRPWIELLRANMRHAGALRLDHAMGIERLLWVPEGATANNGAYVTFDTAAMMAVLAIESHRAKCMVVGEDLGTVPSGFRERMEQAGIYSTRVILFERDGLPFRPAQHYPAQSLAAFGSHDLPPFHGWWKQHQRDADGKALRDVIGSAADVQDASIAMHDFLGKSASRIALTQLDDLAGSETQINVPGTTVERPNWRHRLPRAVPEIFADAQAGRVIGAIARDRATRR